MRANGSTGNRGQGPERSRAVSRRGRVPGEPGWLNIAERCRGTRVLGPGKRYAIWVQGCPFRCRECVSADWQVLRPNRVMPLRELVEEILSDPELEGLTLSGGEPMLQPVACRQLIEAVRAFRPEFTLILYSGFSLAELHAQGHPDRLALLGKTDVLIDGRYEPERNDNSGLRGSANQTVHFLSGVYRGLGHAYFTGRPREVELHLRRDDVFMVGVPPNGLDAALREMLPQ
jgi:anaerobic ribonucleoside-triphosphate reductase activating protein